MKQHAILKQFKGSNDGLVTELFEAGTVAKLSDELAAVAVSQGWAEPAEQFADKLATVEGLPHPIPDGNLAEDLANPHVIETKVSQPEETKPAKPLSKMSKAELVAHGLTLGLELTPDSMNVKQMIAAIEAKE